MELLKTATDNLRAELVAKNVETGKWQPIKCAIILETLRECGGKFADLARRFNEQKNGRRRLADRIRYEIQKELQELGFRSPKKRQRKA